MVFASYLLLQNILIICLMAWMTRENEELVGLTFWHTMGMAGHFLAFCIFLIVIGVISYLMAILQLFKV